MLEEGLRVCVVSEGLSLTQKDNPKPYGRLAALQKKGATVLRGDRVLGGSFEDGRLISVFTRNLGEAEPLSASLFVLATGKFFSRGLMSDKEHIWEPIFGADVDYNPDRSRWFNADFAASQPFMKFCVRTDDTGSVLIGGRPVDNLKAVGDICNE